MTAGAVTLVAPRPSRISVVVASLLAAGLGIGFNVVRAGLQLDRAPVGPAILAFAILAAIAALTAWASRIGTAELGLRGASPTVAVIGTLLVTLVLVAPSLLLHPRPTMALSPGTVLPLVVLYVGFVAPGEELLFRGILFAGLRRLGGPALAIGISAAIFALAHWPVYGPAVIPLDFAAGLLLGWLRWWSRSLGPPIAVHALADLALLVI